MAELWVDAWPSGARRTASRDRPAPEPGGLLTAAEVRPGMRVHVDGIGPGRVASVRGDGIGFIPDAARYTPQGLPAELVPLSSVRRFNPNHGAPGGATGGQFVSAGGSGGGGAKAKAPAGGKPTAHQQHVAHVQHITTHPGAAAGSAGGAKAARKKALLSQAHADRVKAALLGKQLKGLQAQQAKAAQAAKHAHAVVAAAKGGAVQHHTAAQNAAKKATAHHASVKQQIVGLQDQIGALNDKAKALEAQAAKL